MFDVQYLPGSWDEMRDTIALSCLTLEQQKYVFLLSTFVNNFHENSFDYLPEWVGPKLIYHK
jgi:hypothetical protein